MFTRILHATDGSEHARKALADPDGTRGNRLRPVPSPQARPSSILEAETQTSWDRDRNGMKLPLRGKYAPRC